MTAGTLPDAATLDGLVARAGDPQRERWLQQVRRTGACRHPIRLRGVVRRGGELVYSTAGEPDGALMVRCGNRRAECCPSCAREYGGDMWQLIYAGLAGGRKGVPEHPQVFATLTAPGFGAVHTRRDDGRRCRCGRHHDADDLMLGGAIDPAGYDYEGAVLWNWHAPALWNRLTTELVRVLAAGAGLSEAGCRRLVRVAYAKVAEFQARGLVHFHAIIRLDHPEDRGKAPGLRVSADEPAAAIQTAARPTSVQGHAGGGEVLELRLGEQLHTRILADARDGEPLDPEAVAEALRPEAVAAYRGEVLLQGLARNDHPRRRRFRAVGSGRRARAARADGRRCYRARRAAWVGGSRSVGAHARLPRALRHEVARLLHDAR